MIDSTNSLEKPRRLLKKISKKPHELFLGNNQLTSEIKSNLKILYDYVKNQEMKKSKTNALPELIVQNFDVEQIWQQIDLQNGSILQSVTPKVFTFLNKPDDIVFQNGYGAENSSDSVIGDSSNAEDDLTEPENESNIDEENSEDEVSEKPTTNRGKKSEVDDEFFKLHEMEEFLNAEEKKTGADSGNEQDLQDSDNESKESLDFFASGSDESDDENTRQIKYKDFFLAQEQVAKSKRNKFLESVGNEEDDQEPSSTFEQRQKRLQHQIDELEENAVADKPWQLQGEIKADSRPQNSLLEEIVEFDRTSRPAPIITGQTTLQLEDIIKQRIKNRVFDSVERKIKPVETPFEYRKKLVLDQEKSKASLAQIYEKEYLEQKAALDPENEKKEEEPESHKEIRVLLKDLFSQLDSLSNFHYTPKPAIPELKIINNTPAISMEEVAPVGASDAALLAPEEVKQKPRVEIFGRSERTVTDKKRERRKKKLKQKYHAKQIAKREELKVKKKPSKEQAKKNLSKVMKDANVEEMKGTTGRKAIKSSSDFFSKLQEHLQTQSQPKGEKKKENVYNAKKLKL